MKTRPTYLTPKIDESPPAVVLLDSQGRVTTCNPAFESLFLCSRPEIVGEHLDGLTEAETSACEGSGLARRVLGGETVFEKAIRLHRRDGSRITVQFYGLPLSNGHGTGALGLFQDVTRRRQVDRQFRMLKKALETTQLGVTITDVDGKILFTNRADAEMHGYAIEGLMGQDVRVYAPEELWNPMSLEQLRRLRSRRRETVNVRGDGTTFPVQLLSDVVVDQEGEPIAVVTTCEDITQRKEVERQLKILGKVFDNTKLGVTVTDTDGKILYANPAEARMHGCEVRELINQDVRIFAPKELWNPLSLEQLRRLRNRRRETVNVRQDGSVFPVQLTSDVITDKKGEPIAVVTTCEDISLTTAIEQVAEAIMVTDPDGTIQYVNPAFAHITGYTSAEAVGQNWDIIRGARHDEAFFREMWTTLYQGHVWQGRLSNRKKDGSAFEADSTISPVRDPYGKIINFVFVSRDVTREVTLEKERRQSQKMEAIGQLAGGIAHDFNNLLIAIQAHASFARDGLPPGAEGHEDLMQVHRSAERAAALTRQLLAFSRRQILQPVDLGLNQVISDLMKMLERVISEDIELVLIPGPDLATIRADPGQIEQVILNLCVNARDAMPQGGSITLKTRNVHLDADFCALHPWAREGRFVQLTVADTGCGMGEETMSRVFEPFFTTKEVGEGTGLGLATVHGIVEQHGGMIHVASQPGSGTSFEIYFPEAEPELAESPDHVGDTRGGGAETILVAEDDETVRNATIRILEEAGYTALVAENGLEAVRVFKEHAADVALVLMDMVMPVMGGIAAREQVLEIKPDALVMFNTGYTTPAAQPQLLLDNAIPLITKPYSREGLLRRVREVLDGRSPGMNPRTMKDAR